MKINKDQVTDYTGNKKMDKIEVEKWLGRNFNYEIGQGTELPLWLEPK
jgi:hypothetical protein